MKATAFTRWDTTARGGGVARLGGAVPSPVRGHWQRPVAGPEAVGPGEDLQRRRHVLQRHLVVQHEDHRPFGAAARGRGRTHRRPGHPVPARGRLAPPGTGRVPGVRRRRPGDRLGTMRAVCPAKAVRSAPMPLPPTRTACQPNASHLAVTGSVRSTPLAGPSACRPLTSTMAVTLSRPWWAQASAASQVEPSSSGFGQGRSHQYGHRPRSRR